MRGYSPPLTNKQSSNIILKLCYQSAGYINLEIECGNYEITSFIVDAYYKIYNSDRFPFFNKDSLIDCKNHIDEFIKKLKLYVVFS